MDYHTLKIGSLLFHSLNLFINKNKNHYTHKENILINISQQKKYHKSLLYMMGKYF